MNAHGHNLKIVPGKNAWLVQRTDRDDTSAAGAVASSAAVFSRWLNQASPAGLRGMSQTLQATPQGGRFVVGAARPLLVQVSDVRPVTPPEGLRISARASDGQLARAVRARRPWYLSVVFEWHGGPVSIPWPGHFGAVLGSECSSEVDLDWLVLERWEATP